MLEEHKHQHAVHEFDGIIENRVSSPPVYFTVLFYGLVIWGVAFCAFYLLSGWSSDAEFQAKMTAHEEQHQMASMTPEQKTEPSDANEPTPTPPQKEPEATPVAAASAASTEGSASDGKAIYEAKCAMCHGADAKGGFGPDLTADKYEYGKNREAIFHSVSAGRGNGKMPVFEGQLKRQEIYAVTDYLLSLGQPAEKETPAPTAETETSAPAVDVKSLFASHCSACHGQDAKGGFGPDLTAAEYAFGKTREAIVQSISEGRGNGKMPAFEGRLKQNEIDALADYLLSL